MDETAMDKPLLTKYRQFKKAGYQAAAALQAAKILREWQDREWDAISEPAVGDVRLRAEPEYDHPFDVFGEPEGYQDASGRIVSAEEARNEALAAYDLCGVWWAAAEYWNGSEWKVADSIGMIDGCNNPLSPFENVYIPDLMAAAIQQAIEAEENAAWAQRLAERMTERASIAA